ncbi:hypothetical protein QFZ97_005165 [Paraburkholderia youngii]
MGELKWPAAIASVPTVSTPALIFGRIRRAAALAHWREVSKETVLRALCVQMPASVLATTAA